MPHLKNNKGFKRISRGRITYRKTEIKTLFSYLLLGLVLWSCHPGMPQGTWTYELDFGEWQSQGTLIFDRGDSGPRLSLVSLDEGTFVADNPSWSNHTLSCTFTRFGKEVTLNAVRHQDTLKGTIQTEDGDFPFTASKQSEALVVIDRAHLTYVLSEEDLGELEEDIDHAGLIAAMDREGFKRGERIYSSNCINCHGNEEVEGSIPLSTKFWKQDLKAGSDPYSMYQTLSRGFGTMPPQPALTPQDKYDVISYIRHTYLQPRQGTSFMASTPGYLAGLPQGSSRGPATKPYQPWADMDYGNFFINTYELVDAETGIPRYHSPRPVPYQDEDYSKNNFAYKGIAVRLDKGPGGVAQGRAWMIFDHDLMRVAGGWTGKGFIDWNGILLNDQHETYPRTLGKLHFETPVGPGWANPQTGTFEDPRFRARDGRAFGPLPKSWANYKGLYHHNGKVIISYSVGTAAILEKLGMEDQGKDTIFTRTLNISPSKSVLKMRVAPKDIGVELLGEGARLLEEEGYTVLQVNGSQGARIKLFIAHTDQPDFARLSEMKAVPEDLSPYTQGTGAPHYPEVMTSTITKGSEGGAFAVDQLTPPFDNPWASRMKLSGIDFMNDANQAVACTTDGDIWRIKGLLDDTATLRWQRIGSGLFQPLGIKVLQEKIYVICRDQLVLLRDLNGDGETDFYESFNHDHQVTDHFHEFAMGLQADAEGNLYYAKSGRHAREALVPQHGTLLKVSKDGRSTEIIAKGFRAANGVCINPDGTFLVTDQQGFWNPMNRINWVTGKGKFYGNMWGYDPPQDSTRVAMEQPMIWLDMEFDRSPSELLWVDSEQWGPLKGRLLSFSYGFGKIQLVLNEEVQGQMQGGVIDLPGIKFLTGVMRGRFNPIDGQLYACGMSAWGTNQMLRGGGLYRIRYTGKPLTTPIALKTTTAGLTLRFESELAAAEATNPANYTLRAWDIKRTSAYGSDRYNVQELPISQVTILDDRKSVQLSVKGIKPVDGMTISYTIRDVDGLSLQGTVQSTIHHLGPDEHIP